MVTEKYGARQYDTRAISCHKLTGTYARARFVHTVFIAATSLD